MHAGAAHLLQRGLLAGDHLDHAGAPRYMERCRRPSPRCRRRRGCRRRRRRRGRRARRPGGSARAGPGCGRCGPRRGGREEPDLVGDAGAGGVDEVDDGQRVLERAVSMTRMIFSTVRRAPGAGLDGGVVGDQATGRPSTVAVPATTPSAGKSVRFGRGLSSRKESGSTAPDPFAGVVFPARRPPRDTLGAAALDTRAFGRVVPAEVHAAALLPGCCPLTIVKASILCPARARV